MKNFLIVLSFLAFVSCDKDNSIDHENSSENTQVSASSIVGVYKGLRRKTVTKILCPQPCDSAGCSTADRTIEDVSCEVIVTKADSVRILILDTANVLNYKAHEFRQFGFVGELAEDTPSRFVNSFSIFSNRISNNRDSLYIIGEIFEGSKCSYTTFRYEYSLALQ